MLSYRMEGGNNAFYDFDNIVAVVVACVCKLGQGCKEAVGIKLYRVGYMDKVIFGLLKTLLRHKLLFVKLFTFTETGIYDLNINIRLEA